LPGGKKPPLEVTGMIFSLEVGGAPRRQRGQNGALQGDALEAVGIARSDDLIDEGAVGIEVAKVTAAAQQQGILQRLLQMAARTFDGAVLVGDAGVVAWLQ
jgi:hypothetical protein